MKKILSLYLVVILSTSVFAQNVGIGIQSPEAKIHILQDSNAKAFQVDDEIQDNTPFVIDASGNVGIQNSSPTEALDVAGNINATGNIEAGGRVMDKTGYVMPVGTVLPYFGTTAPTGWLLCNGNAVSRTSYADLFNVIGVSSGEGDGFSTFNVPDLRGMFLRGWDNGAGNDPDASSRTAQNTGGNTGDNVGSYQDDATKVSAAGSSQNQAGNDLIRKSSGTQFSDILDNETRPVNVYVNFIIKY